MGVADVVVLPNVPGRREADDAVVDPIDVAVLDLISVRGNDLPFTGPAVAAEVL